MRENKNLQSLQIELFEGLSRTAAEWSRNVMTWPEFVKKCTTFKETRETPEQYAGMSKEQRGKVKDGPGFVGAYLANGERKTQNVKYRTLVTLDADQVDADLHALWVSKIRDAFKGFAVVIYSTHSHTNTAPRFRLVFPLSRQVSPGEYEPLARAVAEKVGINYFDPTTYQAARLFYWPSCSKGAPRFADYMDGAPLDVDAILKKRYKDMTNPAEWPRGNGENLETLEAARGVYRAFSRNRPEDPTKKPGIIGAFCRSYDIEAAIDTFLEDVYEQTATPGRYNYKPGTAGGGLLCTGDGLFAYAFDATNPANNGHLCNAFDLVRIHKFGNGKDSGDKMNEFCRNDEKTNALFAMEVARCDFADLIDETDDPRKWLAELIETGAVTIKKRDVIESTVSNIKQIISHDPHLAGKLWHDEFSGFDCGARSLPWNYRPAEEWDDKDDSNLRVYLDKNFKLEGKEKIFDAVNVVFSEHTRHPVREYLEGLKWDGVRRVDSLLIDYLGADDTALNRAMTRKMLAAAVARVMEPGIKFDCCLVLTGPEGIGKSTILRVLAGNDWFSDSVTTTEGKEGMESLRGVWLVELAELAGIKRNDVEHVKSFLSKTADRFRPAYGKRTEQHPRQCVFFGTTNESDFLKGDTGNRRFWVVPVKGSERRNQIFEQLAKERGQVWAEAVQIYKGGEKLYLDGDLEAEARERQKEHNGDINGDTLPGMLDEYLAARLPADWCTRGKEERRAFFKHRDPLEAESLTRDKIFAGEFVFEYLGHDIGTDLYKYQVAKVNKLMKAKPEWRETRTRFEGYGQQRGFVKCDKI